MSSRCTFAFVAAVVLFPSATGCDRSREAEASSSRSQQAPAISPAPSPAPTHAPSTAPAPALRIAAPPLQAGSGPVLTAISGKPITRAMTLASHLMVERDVGVTARRDGVIGTILADRGDRVKENQPLAELEHGDLTLAEKTAELELQKEQSSFERARKLSEQKIMSDEDYEQAHLRRDAAEKNLERIRYELEKCRIGAPFDGVISGRFVEKGQVIKEDDRRILFQVTAMGPLLARVYVPEWALFGLKRGQPARVTPTGSPVGDPVAGGRGIEARVRWINDVLDPASATAEVLVEILQGPGPGGLKPGMSVQVVFDLSFSAAGIGRDTLVSLPREAFGASEPSTGQQVDLKVVGPDGAVTRRQVAIGFVGDHFVEIRRGLAAGEKVLVDSR
jgi:RND family efflux transporter MFP subunit